VFVSTVGGAKLSGPANDTAIAFAIASAHVGRPLGREIVAIGEIGLSGELRRVRDLPQRLAEAARLGFRAAVVPADSASTAGKSKVIEGMRVLEVGHITEALQHVRLLDQQKQPVTGPYAI
jgi:DNA repair protein RadA/Sms